MTTQTSEAPGTGPDASRTEQSTTAANTEQDHGNTTAPRPQPPAPPQFILYLQDAEYGQALW